GESMSIEVVRTLALAVKNEHIRRVTIRVNDLVAAHLNNKKRRDVMEMEDRGKMTVQILGSEALYPEHMEMDCRDERGERVEIDSGA
ncbi:MAG: ribonuclease E, partial [Rubripirellula sp.]